MKELKIYKVSVLVDGKETDTTDVIAKSKRKAIEKAIDYLACPNCDDFKFEVKNMVKLF